MLQTVNNVTQKPFLWIAIVFWFSGLVLAADVMDLTVELEDNPIGLDTARPRFSWKMKPEDGKRGQMQTAYRLILGTDIEKVRAGEGIVFDSGKVQSDACVLVDILPEDLKETTRYYWTVKVWDEHAQQGAFAPPAQFETGYFSEDFWSKDGAMWIESPLARRNTDEVEHWIRYSVANLLGALGSDSKPGGQYDRFKHLVTDEEVASYEARMKETMRENIWSGSLLRKEFTAGKIVQARLYISGLGYYRAYLNGRKIGDRVLAPSETDFSANVYYNVYDVTEMIGESGNCIGIELVTGRWWERPGNFHQTYYRRPVVIARLELTDRDGNVQAIVTDRSWQAGEHGILRHNFWIGELFDANCYPDGWNTPGFEAARHWQSAVPAGREPAGTMMRDPMPAQRIVEYHKPVAVTEPVPGVYVFDFGKFIAGRAKLKLENATKGRKIVLRYSEVKEGDPPHPVPTAMAWYPGFNNDRQLPGMLQFKRRGSVASHYNLWYGGKDGRERGFIGSYQFGGGHLFTDMYVARGQGEEIFEPKFTWVGFRYVEVLGLEDKPSADTLRAFTLRTDPEFVGSMRTDNAKLNRVLAGTQASLLANFHSNFQDNPGEERNSFIINEGFNIDNAALWFNMYPQLNKKVTSLLARKETHGYYPSLSTSMRHMDWFRDRFFHLSSATAYPNIARGLVAYYNDQRQGKEFALMLTDWVKDICERAYWEHDQYKGSGAHQAGTSLGIFPREKRTRDSVIDRPFFKAAWVMFAGHKTASLLSEMGYADKAAEVNGYLNTFNDRLLNEPELLIHGEKKRVALYDKETGNWDSGAFTRMTVDNLTLLGNLQPRKSDAELVQSIAREMDELGYMTVGVKSVYNLLSTVTQGGYADVAAAVLQRKEYPSMLYSIAHTGGTVAEGWDHQHSYAQIEGLASVGRWFYCDLVGIKPSIASPGFRRFILKPHVPSQVGSFDFTYNSPRGMIESHWNKDGERVAWSITVPPNAIAEVFIPGKEIQGVKKDGIHYIRSENGCQVYELGSGCYTFRFIKVSPISSFSGKK